MRDIRPISVALDQARDELLARPNVVATGIGFKEVAGERAEEIGIVCSVERKVPASELSESELVPRVVAGVPTDVVATGPLRALMVHRERHRPAPGGVSIGHHEVTAGTFGCVVRRGEERFILSNNHVFANTNQAAPGDPVLQPGPYDGGTRTDDTIAALESFVPIEMLEAESACATARRVASILNSLASIAGSEARLRTVSTRVVENLVDAAIARPLTQDMLAEEIIGIGALAGQGMAELGMAIRKSGRTTGVTSGEIVQVHVTADVRMGERMARFKDQFMAGAMSQGGDSGSVMLDTEGRAVGLLFAGSDTTTLCNRMEHVCSALQVSL